MQLLMSSRVFSLLIRVVIYQNVHLGEEVSKSLLIFFQKFEGQGQGSKVNPIKIDGACL